MEKKFTSDEIPLNQLLGDAASGKLQLPDFQRGWVWDDTHISSLLASISVSFPIGAVMTLETGNPDVRFRERPLEGVELSTRVEPKTMLLDGQQRMTSLFQALKAGKPVVTRDQKGKEIRRNYYADINRCIEPDEDREEAIVSVPENGVVRTFGQRIVLDVSTREREIASEHFPLAIVLDQSATMNWFLAYLNDGPGESKDERQAKWEKFMTLLINPFISYHVPTIQLDESTPKEAVCQVFEKLNTGGVSLDVFELITATFAADDFPLREDWETRQRRLHEQPLLESFDAIYFLQVITLLATRDRRLKLLAANPDAERPPAISCKRRDVLRLKLEEYKQYADRAEAAILRAVPFLHNEHVFKAKDIPYVTQLVPLAAILAELGTEADSHAAQEKLRRWYWCGVFGELYGGANETRFAFDFPEVVEWVRGGETEPRTVRDSQFQADRLLSLKTRNSAAYKGFFALGMKRGARDFRTGSPIGVHNYFEDAIDIHHIFPKKWCESRPECNAVVDSVVNRTSIDATTNNQIGGDAPSDYLRKIEARHMIKGAALDGMLRTHDIDPLTLRTDDFASFFNDRFEKLLSVVESATGKPVNRSEDRDESPFAFELSANALRARVQGLIEADESGTVEFKSTARVNMHTQQRDPRMETAIVKSIAGLSNANGGTLLVGVEDESRAIVGIETDYPTLGNKQNPDGWQLWLSDLTSHHISKPTAASLTISLTEIDGRTVAAIQVPPAHKPTFATTPDSDKSAFLVRINNSTRELEGSEMLEYQQKRWAVD